MAMAAEGGSCKKAAMTISKALCGAGHDIAICGTTIRVKFFSRLFAEKPLRHPQGLSQLHLGDGARLAQLRHALAQAGKESSFVVADGHGGHLDGQCRQG
jgi:hypothetical protein